jgi:hypothetical protein
MEESKKRMTAEIAALLMLVSSNTPSNVESSAYVEPNDARVAEEEKEADISSESLAAPITISFGELGLEVIVTECDLGLEEIVTELLPEDDLAVDQSVSILADATDSPTEVDISSIKPEPNLPDSSWQTVSSKAAAKKPKAEKPKRWIGANGKFSSTVPVAELRVGDAYRGEVLSVTYSGSFIRFGNDAIVSSKHGMVRNALEIGTWHHFEVTRVSNGKVDLKYLAPL